MHIISKITAAVALAGGLSIASQVWADPICDMGMSILNSTIDMREAGISRRTAASVAVDVVEDNADGLSSQMTLQLTDLVLTIVDGAYDLPADYLQHRSAITDAFLEGCEGEDA